MSELVAIVLACLALLGGGDDSSGSNRQAATPPPSHPLPSAKEVQRGDGSEIVYGGSCPPGQSC